MSVRAGLAYSLDPPPDGLIRSQPALSPPPLGLCNLCRGRPARSIRRGEHDKMGCSHGSVSRVRSRLTEARLQMATTKRNGGHRPPLQFSGESEPDWHPSWTWQVNSRKPSELIALT